MKITKRLDLIEKLILDRAEPAKIRDHVISIREQLEAYESDAKKIADLKKEIAKLRADNLKLSRPPITSRFKDSDPVSHILVALASLGEGLYDPEEVSQQAGEPVVKTRECLKVARDLGYVELSNAKYRLCEQRIFSLIAEGTL